MIEFQRLLLGDTIRNDAFARALKAAIVPGKTTVADIGSGTGYLSFLAEQFGAKECFLYEMTDLLRLSEKIGKQNGIKRCTYFQLHSMAAKPAQQVDLVVSETLGNFALEENILETLNDAHRFLKPGGMMIPHGLTQFAAPVITSRLYDELNVWESVGHGLDFSIAKEVCLNNMYVKDISPEDLLPSSTTLFDTIDFTKKNESIRSADMEWSFDSDETLYGFGIWWDAALLKDITLSTSPFAPTTHWKQIYLPLVDPLPVKKGQRVKLHLWSDTRYEVKIHLKWDTSVLDAQGKTLTQVKQDIRKGYIA